ncbi:MAG: hypothetical protein RJB62_526 [Pseudomonadota bacterium]|jgi:hypothetical protein
MNDIHEYRIIPNRRPFRIFGCLGCLLTVFVLGGIFGLLALGWKALLGL